MLPRAGARFSTARASIVNESGLTRLAAYLFSVGAHRGFRGDLPRAGQTGLRAIREAVVLRAGFDPGATVPGLLSQNQGLVQVASVTQALLDRLKRPVVFLPVIQIIVWRDADT